MSSTFTLKSTGEVFTLPTPGEGQTEIDSLPAGDSFTKKEIKEYFAKKWESIKMKYKTVVVSDLHIFKDGSKYEECFQFLKGNPSKKIILNGDIFDFVYLFKHWSNYKKYKHVMRAFRWFMMVRGTKIIFLIGNHDYHYYLLKIIQPFLGIRIKKFYTFESIKGTIHATHGDWIPYVLKIKRFFNKSIKITGVEDEDYITYGLLKKYDVLICGHTHGPFYHTVNKLLYINTGDWMDDKMAAVEDFTGSWYLLQT
jgi:UDP-2,3-diacylglucosamine pyrophosphatase LpxH